MQVDGLHILLADRLDRKFDRELTGKTEGFGSEEHHSPGLREVDGRSMRIRGRSFVGAGMCLPEW